MSKALIPLTETAPTTVKAATDFLRRKQNLTMADDEVMVSFDVVSLFTSIPQGLAHKAIRQLLESGNNNISLTTDEMMNFLEFCLNTVFMFDGKIYQQVKGTPMRSLISGVIAEAVLQKLEQEVLPRCPPKFWARYVDDTFVVVERNRVDMLWDQLNSLFPDIQFIRELEQNNKIAFLDVLVTREESERLTISVYRKPTTTSSQSMRLAPGTIPSDPDKDQSQGIPTDSSRGSTRNTYGPTGGRSTHTRTELHGTNNARPSTVNGRSRTNTRQPSSFLIN